MRIAARLSICALTAILAAATTARAAGVGNCNGDDAVTIDELVRGVAIALGQRALADCPSYDADGDGTVAINELIAAVNNALDGIPPELTPSPEPPTATATPSLTATATVTDTPTHTVTLTATATQTAIATATSSASPTPTVTGTAVTTATTASTATSAATVTPTDEPTQSLTASAAPTATATAALPATATATVTGTATDTASATATRTSTATHTSTATPTATASPTPSATATRTLTRTPTPTRTRTPTATGTATRTPTATVSATRTLTASATATPSITAAPNPTATPLFVVIDIGQVAGGQPCEETSVPFQIPDGSTRSVESVAIDLCVDASRFDVFGIICDSENDNLSDLTIFPDCQLDDPQNPRGQVHFIVDASSPSGLAPGAEFAVCRVPVLPTTLAGSYPVRFRALATSEGVTVVNAGQDEIQVFATGLGQGACCGVDAQCSSGFCRDGLEDLNKACCESDCALGICNDPDAPGECQP